MPTPEAEIVVSAWPASPKPLQTGMEGGPSVDEPMVDAEPYERPHDEHSKKSFKRKYRKLLNKYFTIRANNQTLHQTLQRAIATASQLSNENAYILDYILGLNPGIEPQSPPYDEEFDPPSPSTFNRDAHFGYSPTPSPPGEVATQLTKDQISLGMFKVEGNSSSGMMGHPMSMHREDESADAFRSRGQTVSGSAATASGGRGSTRLTMASTLSAATRRKRKDRDSDVDDNLAPSSKRKSRA